MDQVSDVYVKPGVDKDQWCSSSALWYTYSTCTTIPPSVASLPESGAAPHMRATSVPVCYPRTVAGPSHCCVCRVPSVVQPEPVEPIAPSPDHTVCVCERARAPSLCVPSASSLRAAPARASVSTAWQLASSGSPGGGPGGTGAFESNELTKDGLDQERPGLADERLGDHQRVFEAHADEAQQ